ncbi:hypothetical protein [Sphingomonas sp. MMS24-J13]|uniref:hypothetical protein n=1 Tax=Sphingomonas sp. MMS24-J13 TaxID=3238686 RepID=UPI00384A48AF
MTLDTLFLMIVLIYLVLIAYGVVGMLKRKMVGRPKRVTEILIVLVPPAMIAGLLTASGEGGVVIQWGLFIGAMPIAGAIVVVLTELIARRIEP